ncbi:efflux transporter periplasmic adaptor subunit [Christiangramia fulva]|uniref:Efflux transporter periplasmic adaptor subunit n=1 Tax=Christiangramia fulva TaxID=2126553 RepID=A0A2R3Z5L6_9FLAO|nr:efflux RND transporter periplasmic adaptor subunit [Christiangramia fulva]AVR45577.1 efflux transporter periplasmic adaptor subunit [Christiangramia fulva]
MKRYIFIFFLLLSCSNKKEGIMPVKADLVESVYSSVTIQPDSLYKAYSTVVAILDRNLLEEGALVQEGTPILKLINLKPALSRENAKLSFELAKENSSGNNSVLNSLEREIRAASLSFYNDSVNYLRQKTLWEQEIGSKVEFENRKLAYELSRNNLQLLKKEYERTRKELSNQVQQALNNYRSSEFTAEEFTITSNINGKLYALYKNPGELVTTVEPVALLGRADKFIIEMLVDETDIVKIEEGQKTLVTLDAYGQRVFEGTIHKIYPTKDERTQTFKIEAVFNEAPPKLYPGLAGEANILIAEKKDALTIPKEYLIDADHVLTDDGIRKIRTGLQDIEKVEILSGLKEDETIYKPEQ